MDKKESKELAKKLNKMFEEQTFSNLIRYIIAETFARHSKMSEEEFVKELGFDPKIGEDKAIRIASYNIIIEIMKLKLKNQETIKTMQAVLTLALDEKEKGESNGK